MGDQSWGMGVWELGDGGCELGDGSWGMGVWDLGDGECQNSSAPKISQTFKKNPQKIHKNCHNYFTMALLTLPLGVSTHQGMCYLLTKFQFFWFSLKIYIKKTNE